MTELQEVYNFIKERKFPLPTNEAELARILWLFANRNPKKPESLGQISTYRLLKIGEPVCKATDEVYVSGKWMPMDGTLMSAWSDGELYRKCFCKVRRPVEDKNQINNEVINE